MEDYYKRIAEEYEEIYFRSDLGIQKELINDAGRIKVNTEGQKSSRNSVRNRILDTNSFKRQLKAYLQQI